MEKVENMETVQTYLKEGRILCFISDNRMVKFLTRQGKLHIYSDVAHYVLTWKDFIDLYQQETIYLYEQEEELVEISKEKDDEYYGWYHK